MSYVTLEDFKQYLRNEAGGLDNTYLQSCLDSATLAINSTCGRSFSVASGSSTRLYVPSQLQAQAIHDCTAVSAVAMDGAAISSTVYQLEPLNGLSMSGESRPYDRLVRVDGFVWWSWWPNKASLSVTATWGWPATPANVIEACRLLAKDISSARNVQGGMVTSGDFAMRAVQNPTIQWLLKDYRRGLTWGQA